MRAKAKVTRATQNAAGKMPHPSKRNPRITAMPTARIAVADGGRPVLCDNPWSRAWGKAAMTAGIAARDSMGATKRAVSAAEGLVLNNIQSAVQRPDKDRTSAITP